MKDSSRDVAPLISQRARNEWGTFRHPGVDAKNLTGLPPFPFPFRRSRMRANSCRWDRPRRSPGAAGAGDLQSVSQRRLGPLGSTPNEASVRMGVIVGDGFFLHRCEGRLPDPASICCCVVGVMLRSRGHAVHDRFCFPLGTVTAVVVSPFLFGLEDQIRYTAEGSRSGPGSGQPGSRPHGPPRVEGLPGAR